MQLFHQSQRKALDVDDDRAAASSLRAHRNQEIQFNIKPQICMYVCTADTASLSLLKVRSSVVSNYPEKITRKQKYHSLTHSHAPTKKKEKKKKRTRRHRSRGTNLGTDRTYRLPPVYLLSHDPNFNDNPSGVRQHPTSLPPVAISKSHRGSGARSTSEQQTQDPQR